MKKLLLTCGALSLIAGVPVAQAAVSTYKVTTTWFEPDTQPRDSIFIGSFKYDPDAPTGTSKVSDLKGILSESMTGDPVAFNPDPKPGEPVDNMTWLTLGYQLQSWQALEGTFVATFKNTNTNTFSTMFGGDGWSPQAGVDVGGIYYGYPKPANNPGNAYALIFVPNDPLTSLTQAQLDKVAYADCAPGGMMGAVCMTGTSEAGYGAIGTMSGFPVSQVITLAPVPEPESYAMLLAGLGLLGFIARRRRQAVQ